MKTKTKTNLLAIAVILMSFISCQKTTTVDTLLVKKGMVKVTILYPNSEGAIFDMDYYASKHMPMVADLLGAVLKSYEIDKGIGGRTPEDSIPYLAIGYLYFENLTDYQNGMAENGGKIVSDIPNYTNIQPIIQISEVM